MASTLAPWLLCLAVLVGLAASANAKGEISPDVAAKLSSQGALLIDVRTPQEFNAGHLATAQNIEYQAIATLLPKQLTDKTQPIVLYCRSGRRAEIAKQALQQLGYSDVVNAGGYAELKEAFAAATK
ncbi:rhodanese-like domain-containing protein [Shewanella sp.]|uniref:rhodanese-like domain-containing protein n=1 Tax=Shewanella sp. TaxID=50422 RepID=UPI003A97C4B4